MYKNYVYKKKSLIALATIIDTIGDIFLKIKNLLIPKKAYSNEAHRILIIKLDHAGDVLMSTPAIKAIRNTFPKEHITLVIGPWSANIIKGNKNVDEVIIFKAYWHDRDPNKSIKLRDIYNLIKSLRKQNYDLFFDLRGDIFAIIIAFLAGIPRRIGYGWEGGRFLLTDEVKTSIGKHQTEILLDAITPIKEKPAGKLLPEITISDDDKEIASKLLQTSKWNPRIPLIGFHLGAGYPSKLWKANRYGELMNLITEKYNVQILIVGGFEDKFIYENIKENLNFKPITAIGKTKFSETAALIERCSLFIGNDSAPVHIAAAVGTPTVVIFSAANDWNRWRPYGENVLVIMGEVDCINCEKKVCTDTSCMDTITVKEVLSKIEGIKKLWN